MIESNFENLIKAYRKVAMTPDEKKEVFKQSMLVIEKIEAVSMNSHGYQTETGILTEVQKGKQVFALQFMSYFKKRQFIPAFLAAFLLLFTGGASLLAESALPGDSLYAFKVNINEPIKDLAAVSDEAKARVALEITERRLQEAALLSAQGRLDANNKKLLQDQVVKRAEQIRNRVASLVSSNNLGAAEEVAVDFESKLKTHELILESLAGELKDPQTVVATLSSTDDIDAAGISAMTLAVDAGISAKSASSTAVGVNSSTKISMRTDTFATPEVSSLLLTIKSELDSATNARINIQEKVTAKIASMQASSTSATSTMSAQVISESMVDANIKELRFMISDIERELSQFAYSATTTEIVKDRLVKASTTLSTIPELLKRNQILEAASTTRVLLQGLTQIETVLRLEKSASPALDGKIDIKSLFESSLNNPISNINPDNGATYSPSQSSATSTSQSQSSLGGVVSGTIIQ